MVIEKPDTDEGTLTELTVIFPPERPTRQKTSLEVMYRERLSE